MAFFGAIYGSNHVAWKRRKWFSITTLLTLPNTAEIHLCVVPLSRHSKSSPKDRRPIMSNVVQLNHFTKSCDSPLCSRRPLTSFSTYERMMGCWSRMPFSENECDRRRRNLE